MLTCSGILILVLGLLRSCIVKNLERSKLGLLRPSPQIHLFREFAAFDWFLWNHQIRATLSEKRRFLLCISSHSFRPFRSFTLGFACKIRYFNIFQRPLSLLNNRHSNGLCVCIHKSSSLLAASCLIKASAATLSSNCSIKERFSALCWRSILCFGPHRWKSGSSSVLQDQARDSPSVSMWHPSWSFVRVNTLVDHGWRLCQVIFLLHFDTTPSSTPHVRASDKSWAVKSGTFTWVIWVDDPITATAKAVSRQSARFFCLRLGRIKFRFFFPKPADWFLWRYLLRRRTRRFLLQSSVFVDGLPNDSVAH